MHLAHLELDQLPFEGGAVGVVADGEGVEEVEVAALEEGAFLGLGADFAAAVHRFLRDDEVAGDDVGHGVERDGVGDSADAEGVVTQDGDVGIAIQEGVLAVGQVVERLPDFFLEGGAEEVKVIPRDAPVKGREVGSGDFLGCHRFGGRGSCGGELGGYVGKVVVIGGHGSDPAVDTGHDPLLGSAHIFRMSLSSDQGMRMAITPRIGGAISLGL